jgi:hypothetical protein
VTALLLTWFIILICVVHDKLKNLGWNLSSCLLLEFGLTAGLLYITFFWLMPALNNVFFNVPVVTEVDPHALTIFRASVGLTLGSLGAHYFTKSSSEKEE